jgi:hypothetical protein
MELKLDNWESFLYESRPFAYVALGVYALAVDKPDLILMGAAALLIFCGILVLRMRYAARAGSSLESLYYESLPFLYLGVGVYAIVFMEFTKIAVGAGVILLFCATKVFHWRIRNRRAVLAMIARRPADEQKKADAATNTHPLA